MTAKAPLRLALIDGDTGFVGVVGKRFEGMGWQHRVIGGPVPEGELAAMRLNALVIDPETLGTGAWDFLEAACAALPELGVLVCTARSTVAQRVRGLRLGADDWIAKPCHAEELVARIEAVVRRRQRSSSSADVEPLRFGELEIRPDRFQAYVSGQSAELTRREFELLRLLADTPGLVLEREHVYERVWGYAMAHGDRSVDVFIRKVRQKIERLSPGWRYVHTHFGIGYRFQPESLDHDAGEEENGPVAPTEREPVGGIEVAVSDGAAVSTKSAGHPAPARQPAEHRARAGSRA